MLAELTPEKEASRVEAREAVLAAKKMLATVAGASLLSREAFINICVEASLSFLREKKRQKSNGDHDSRLKPNTSFSPHSDVKRSSGKKSRHHHRGGGSSDDKRNHTAKMKRRHDASGIYRKYEQDDRGEGQKKENPQLSQFSEEELGRLRELVEREYTLLRHEDAVGTGVVVPAQFSALPPAKLEAATIIRQVLEDPYRRGAISRQQYAVIVLAVMEKLFPDLVTVTNDAMVSYHKSLSRNRSSSDNSVVHDRIVEENDVQNGEEGFMEEEEEEEEEEEMFILDPPQELHTALRPDVAELTRQLTERALQHYLQPDNNTHGRQMVEGEGCRGGCVINDVSPLPRNPYGTNKPQDFYQDSTSTSMSVSVQFDDAFEEQVEKLCQLLEKKYALDLSSARATTLHPRGTESRDNISRGAVNNKKSKSGCMLTVNAGSPSSCDDECTGETAAAAAATRERREELLTAALHYQEELYQTQTRLRGIMQELYETEHSKSDPIV
ncbi:hypothetical protein MOQ_000057 [Trypanosoma cruzi marinkellei]|uniref:Uncharacterized protein n=1 Tax=Trypanosoma cruzi marinkellei TaxID=85056 RepID=K2NPE1_TRYCR|nr:hypothetical protein MOQ_000057 [Trypanosoma cruzi marinkellei]